MLPGLMAIAVTDRVFPPLWRKPCVTKKIFESLVITEAHLRRQKIKNPDYATMWIIFCDNVDYDNVDYATMWIINPHCRNPHF